MDRALFQLSGWLSSPPGFYFLIGVMAVMTLFVPLGWTDIVTYILSVAAIVISGVVLIQGYRDTAAIHAKLDELILAQRRTHNDLVDIEHQSPSTIRERLKLLSEEAKDPNCRSSN